MSRATDTTRPIEAPSEVGFVDGESPIPGRVNETRSNGKKPVQGRSGDKFRWLGSALKLGSGLLIVVGAALAVAWGAHRYALTTPRFAIERMEVVGARRFSTAQIAKMAGVERGQNIFSFSTEAAEAKLLENPWLREVKITRQLPGGLRVEVSEREALAIAVIDGQLFLVTRTGEPFKTLEDGDPYDLPTLTGISLENLARDRARELDRVRTGLEVLRHYDRLPLSRVYPAQEVHLEAGGEVVLSIGRQGISLHLGEGPWRQKLLMAADVMSRLSGKGRVPGMVFLDNQAHPERVVVRMR